MTNVIYKLLSAIAVSVTISFAHGDGTWNPIDLDDKNSFNNDCEYRIKSNASGEGKTTITGHQVNPGFVGFNVGGSHNPSYISCNEKKKLCSSGAEPISYKDANGETQFISSKECKLHGYVISLEERCQSTEQ